MQLPIFAKVQNIGGVIKGNVSWVRKVEHFATRNPSVKRLKIRFLPPTEHSTSPLPN